MSFSIQRILLNITEFASMRIGKIHMPGSRKLITSKDYRSIKPFLRPGMVILSYTRGEFSNWFIPGDWAHAAFIVDSTTVIEATTHGVVKTDLTDFMFKKDFIILLEPLFATELQMNEAVKIALSMEGLPYNYRMEYSASGTNIKGFYCSELLTYAFKKACSFMPFTLRKILGIMTVAPGDFYEAKDKFKLVWESESLKQRS